MLRLILINGVWVGFGWGLKWGLELSLYGLLLMVCSGFYNLFMGYDIPKPHSLYALLCIACSAKTGVWDSKTLYYLLVSLIALINYMYLFFI